jgi:hypothetical protein
MNDWARAVEQIDATALRTRTEALDRLAAIEPPVEFAARHAAAVEAWRSRLATARADPVEGVERAVAARTCQDELLGHVPADSPDPVVARYAAALARLRPLDQRGAAAVALSIEEQGQRLVRSLERVRPPAARSEAHSRLLELVRRYVHAQKEIYATVARKDRTAARSLAEKYAGLNAELTAEANRVYEQATG